jgi:NADPH:quinone reductase
VKPGDTVLIRGGTSSVGLVAALLAKQRGMRVLATTRKENRTPDLLAVGVDEVVVDDGAIVERVRELVPGGVDGALELVGAPTLRDTLQCTRPGGTVCFTGMLSNKWIIEQFYPIDFIPTGVRLTAYGGGAADLPSSVLSDVANAIQRGELSLPTHTYQLEEIQRAHDDMEHDKVLGKQVVLNRAGH